MADSFPLPACAFARAAYCSRFRFAGEAVVGFDSLHKATFFGFRVHLRTSREGVILDYQLAPARASDGSMVWELNPPAGSTGIGDRAYGSATLREEMAAMLVRLLAPPVRRSLDQPSDQKRNRQLASVRYRLETTNSQLVVRYQAKGSWARDLWHLGHRLIRKILSHTTLVWLCVQAQLPPLAFDRLIGGE